MSTSRVLCIYSEVATMLQEVARVARVTHVPTVDVESIMRVLLAVRAKSQVCRLFAPERCLFMHISRRHNQDPNGPNLVPLEQTLCARYQLDSPFCRRRMRLSRPSSGAPVHTRGQGRFESRGNPVCHAALQRSRASERSCR